MYSINPLPLLFTSLLTLHGLRRRSISTSGSIVGFIVGYIFLSSTIHAFPTALLIFYLLGSYATRLGASRKSQLEQDHDAQGYRTATQVLSNSLPALVATLLWHHSFADTYDPTAWCPTSPGYTRALVLAILGSVHSYCIHTAHQHLISHFACCLGDTLASELGILSTHPPILITTLRTVPPGTNGAISFGGTLASVFGGGLIGAGMGLSLVIENTVCRQSPFSLAGTLVLWGAVAGGVGSLVSPLQYELRIALTSHPT
jgi:uncharacterized membrane protein